MKEKLDLLKQELSDVIVSCNNLDEIENITRKYIGKDSEISKLFSKMGEIPNEDKKSYAEQLNNAKRDFSEIIDSKKLEIEKNELMAKLENETIDETLDGWSFNIGTRHLLSQIKTEVENILVDIGFEVIPGIELEEEKYNFENLNINANHPARDMQDSYFIDNTNLLRTHCTNMTARVLDANPNKNIKFISVGKVYRNDEDDATHSHQFMQVDAACVNENASIVELKGVLIYLIKKLFGNNVDTRIRPSFFPFTEPSVEIDMECQNCNEGCSICKWTKWIEILGGGMLHPNVLNNSGFDLDRFQGYAFGIGIDRIAMIKYLLTDIRDLYKNDLRFNKQFFESEDK